MEEKIVFVLNLYFFILIMLTHSIKNILCDVLLTKKPIQLHKIYSNLYSKVNENGLTVNKIKGLHFFISKFSTLYFLHFCY